MKKDADTTTQESPPVIQFPGSLLDAAALKAFPEKLRICPDDKNAVREAYNAGEEFIAEKRRREKWLK